MDNKMKCAYPADMKLNDSGFFLEFKKVKLSRIGRFIVSTVGFTHSCPLMILFFCFDCGLTSR